MKTDQTHIDITLSRPVAIDGTDVTTLRMREPLVRDQRAAQEMADNDPLLSEVILFANLCGIPHELVDGMRMKDYKALQKAYAGFTN